MKSPIYSVNLQKCKKCPYFSKSDVVMKTHLIRHKFRKELFSCERRNLEEFWCETCSFKSHFVRSFIEHVKRDKCQKAEIPSISRKSDPKLHNYNTSGMLFDCEKSTIEEFICDRCHFSTPFLINHKQHLKQCCQNQNKTTSEKKWYRCKQCDYKSKTSSNLSQHVNSTHIPDHVAKWYQCQHCDYKSKRISNLNQHRRFKHRPDIKWHRCDQCDFKCRHVRYLKRHVDCEHRGINWQHCQFCDYKCKTVNNLKYHTINKHTSEQNIQWHECEHCEYRSAFLEYLKKHVRNKHTLDVDIKWYYCEHCDYKSKRGYVLKRHVYIKHNASEDVKK